MRIYTRKGDDGTTGLFYGGRVRKDSVLPTAYGAVDEAQAALGVARALLPGAALDDPAHLDAILVGVCGDLYVVMAELATDPANRHKLVDGQSRVEQPMVDRLEGWIDEVSARFDPPTEFVVPGGSSVSAALDVARTVVRRAERHALAAGVESALGVAYLNRLSDLVWTLARWVDGTSLLARTTIEEHP